MSVGTSKATDKFPLLREFNPIKQLLPSRRGIRVIENVEKSPQGDVLIACKIKGRWKLYDSGRKLGILR